MDIAQQLINRAWNIGLFQEKCCNHGRSEVCNQESAASFQPNVCFYGAQRAHITGNKRQALAGAAGTLAGTEDDDYMNVDRLGEPPKRTQNGDMTVE